MTEPKEGNYQRHIGDFVSPGLLAAGLSRRPEDLSSQTRRPEDLGPRTEVQSGLAYLWRKLLREAKRLMESRTRRVVRNEVRRVSHGIDLLHAKDQCLEDQNRLLLMNLSDKTGQLSRQLSTLTARIEALSQRFVIPQGNGLVLARTRYGYVALSGRDAALLAHVAEGIVPDPGTASVIERILRPGARFLDIGANVGLMSLLAARLVGPNGYIVACEPTPETVDLLRTTIRLNNLGQTVRIVECAAGATTGRSVLHLGLTSSHNSLFALPEANETIEVEVRPLDAILEPGSRWDLAKIDVEGAELDVIQGMQRLLLENRTMPLIVEFGPAHLKRRGLTVEGWFETLRTMNLIPYEIDEHTGMLKPLRRTGLRDVVSMDPVLLRDRYENLASLFAA